MVHSISKSLLLCLALLPFQTISSHILSAFINFPTDSSNLSWEYKLYCFPYHLYDLINIASAKVDEKGQIYMKGEGSLEKMKEIVEKTHKYKKKVLLSVGGKLEMYDNTFGSIILNLEEFKKNLEEKVEELNLDGINIDWSWFPNEEVLFSIASSFKNSSRMQGKLLTFTNPPLPTLPSTIYDFFDYIHLINFNNDDDICIDGSVNSAAMRTFNIIPNKKVLSVINFLKYGQNSFEDPETTRLLIEAVEKFHPDALGGISVWQTLFDSGAENKECQWEGSEILARVLNSDSKVEDL